MRKENEYCESQENTNNEYFEFRRYLLNEIEHQQQNMNEIRLRNISNKLHSRLNHFASIWYDFIGST